MSMTMAGNKTVTGCRAATAFAASVLCAIVVLLAWLLKYELALSGLYLFKCLIGALVIIGVLSRARGQFAPGGQLVIANLVTLVRAILVVFLLSMLAEPVNVLIMWAAVLMAGVASITDAVDGWVARRMGTASAFGARFDMETDAALIAALALLAWYWERAGAWVLLAGAARYLFVLGTCFFRSMRRELPPSMRRKVVCVVQIIALLLCLVPVLPPVVAALCAALGVIALSGSFMVDTLWLMRAAQPREGEAC